MTIRTCCHLHQIFFYSISVNALNLISYFEYVKKLFFLQFKSLRLKNKHLHIKFILLYILWL